MSLFISDSGTTLSAQSVAEIPMIFRAYVENELADPGELVADGRFGVHEARPPGRDGDAVHGLTHWGLRQSPPR